MPEAFTALSMSLLPRDIRWPRACAGGRACARAGAYRVFAVAAADDCGISATDALDDLFVRIDAPGLSLVALALKVTANRCSACRPAGRGVEHGGGALSSSAAWMSRRRRSCRRIWSRRCRRHVRGAGAAFGRFSLSWSCDAAARALWCWSALNAVALVVIRAHYAGGAMSALAAVAACLCALSVFVATGRIGRMHARSQVPASARRC